MKNLKEAVADARAGKSSSTLCPVHEDRNTSPLVRPPGSCGWIVYVVQTAQSRAPYNKKGEA